MSVFASIHLGKCAGAAFANLLIDRVSRQMPVFLFYGGAHPMTGIWRDGSREPIKNGNSLKEVCAPFVKRAQEGESFLMQSHLMANEYLEFLPRDSKFFTWLREPLQRICSHYYYWKNNRRAPRLSPEAKPLFDRVVAGDCSLAEFGSHPLIAEYYSAMLAPLGLDGLALALLVEHPTNSFMQLSQLLGVEMPSEMRVANVTQSKPTKVYELTQAEESQLRGCNSSDMELYHRAVARLLRPSHTA